MSKGARRNETRVAGNLKKETAEEREEGEAKEGGDGRTDG